MDSAPANDTLKDVLNPFLLFLRKEGIHRDLDTERLSKFRRLADVRLQRLAVGKPRLTATDLCGLLVDDKGVRFDTIAAQCGLLSRAALTAPLKSIGEETGYLAELCVLLQVMGPDTFRPLIEEFAARRAPSEGSLPSQAAPEPPLPSEAPLPPEVAKLLGNVKGLWSIPTNTRKILEMLSDPDTPLDRVCGDIEKDPGLSAHCLKAVNSAIYALQNRVSSIRRAVTMLGTLTTQRLVRMSSLMSTLGRVSPDVEFDLKAFWGHSLWVAHAAAAVAKATGFGQPDEHFSAGLIHDIGKLVVMQHLPVHARRIQATVKAGSGYEDVELRILGVSHCVIGACVCERWGFPPPIVSAIRHHLDPLSALEELQLPREAFVVSALCRIAKASLGPEELESWCQFLRLPAARIEQIRAEAGELSIGSLRDVYHVS